MQSRSNTERDVCLGIIGAGAVVRSLHMPVLRQIPGLRIEWIMDAAADRAAALAEDYGVPAATTDLSKCGNADAVLLAIPVGVRDNAWKAILERGWDVLCEKPAAASLREFDDLVDAMKARERIFHTGLMRRFYATTQLARHLVRDGLFGDLVEVWVAEGGRQTRSGRGSEWYQVNRALSGGGILIETGSHLLDQMMYITSPTSVQLESYEQRPVGNTIEYMAHALGHMEIDARVVQFTCLLDRSRDICDGIFLRFEKAVIRIEHGPAGQVSIESHAGNFIAALAPPSGFAQNSFQAFRAEWIEFLTHCRARDLKAASDLGSITRHSVKLIDDCYRGALEEPGRPQHRNFVKDKALT